ncbi:MAG: TraR/DksA C4-type zinc finger protein [Nevskia sp.]|nr:TraR/DksA C4-type zinc finger protein [Nevskia sp.]
MNAANKKPPLDHAEAAKASLEARRSDLADRVASIERSRRRGDAPLSADSEERSVERENDEVLDRLADTTRRELEQVRHALDRIHAGRYGVCERCGQPIPAQRLRAVPEATRCSGCADGARR